MERVPPAEEWLSVKEIKKDYLMKLFDAKPDRKWIKPLDQPSNEVLVCS